MRHVPAVVRLATQADEAAILRLCWQAHAERNERSPSEEKALAHIRHVLAGNGVIGLIDVDGDVRALCGLIVTSPWCSEDLQLNDWLVYVRPDCRHLRYLTPLLNFAKDAATRMNIPLWMGWIGDERSEAKSNAYRRHYEKFGEFYYFDPRKRAA